MFKEISRIDEYRELDIEKLKSLLQCNYDCLEMMETSASVEEYAVRRAEYGVREHGFQDDGTWWLRWISRAYKTLEPLIKNTKEIIVDLETVVKEKEK